MSLLQPQTVDELANVWDAAVAVIEALAEQVKRGKVNGQLTEVHGLLEALPLGSGDFCRMGNNLRNAERYMRSQEWGAASYELRMLAGAVRNCLFALRNGESRPRRTHAHPALFEERK